MLKDNFTLLQTDVFVYIYAYAGEKSRKNTLFGQRCEKLL